MNATTAAVTVELTPQSRLDIIDIAQHLFTQHDGILAPFSKLLFCSIHTTAGYLEQNLAAKMHHRRDSVETFIRSAQRLFPRGAPYWHDQMNLRSELSEEQKAHEPQNADSHLAFIGLGLESCVTYDNSPDVPVYFIDLDGVSEGVKRNRRSLVVGYNAAEHVVEHTLRVPVANRAIDSVNLNDPRLGIAEQIDELLTRYEVRRGAAILSLDVAEQHAGLTVNEYETLLVKNDLAGVLHNPLRYMVRGAASIVRDPRNIARKAKNFIAYDLVQIMNEVIDTVGRNVSILERVIDRLGIDLSILERVIDRVATASTSRWMGLNRSVKMLVNSSDGEAPGSIVLGTYQSPILIQWRRPEAQTRTIRVRLVRFE